MAFNWARGRTQGGNALAHHVANAYEALSIFGDRLLEHASAPVADPPAPGSSSQLAIGIGGDIPLYPPLLVVLLMVVALVLHRSRGARFLPPPLCLFVLRSGLAMAVFAWADKTRREAAFYSQRMSTDTIDFAPVTTLVTDGPYAHSRNPVYQAMAAVLPAAALLFDSAWLLAVAPALPAYLHWAVVPAEEQLLRRKFGSTYAFYESKVHL